MNFLFKHFFYFIIFFILFNFESHSIANIKISILWKIPLIAFMLIYVLTKFENKYIFPSFVVFGLIFSLKNLIYIGPYHYMLQSFIESVKYLTIPLFTYYFILRYSGKPNKVYEIAIIISVYIILSTIPFLLHILSSSHVGYDLSIYGQKGSGFVGIFENPHSAALSLSFALIIILKQFQTEATAQKKQFYFALLIVGGIALFQTYVRTGYMIFLIAAIYLFYWKKSIKVYLKHLPIIIIAIIGFFIIYQSSPILQMRFSDKTIYTKNKKINEFRSLGSGRLLFTDTAIKNWDSKGLSTILVGYGFGNALDYMKQAIGMRIFAHNGFVDIIQMNGLIGMFLYLLFIISLYKLIKKRKSSKYYQISLVFFIAYFLFMFLQGGHFFLPEVIISATLAALYLDEKTITTIKGKIYE